MPAAPAGIEAQPTLAAEPPGSNGNQPTAEAQAAAADIARQQEDGRSPRDILMTLAAPSTQEGQAPASAPVDEGNVASPDVSAATTLPHDEVLPQVEPREDRQQTDAILHEASKLFLKAHDQRLYVTAMALAMKDGNDEGAPMRREFRQEVLRMIGAMPARELGILRKRSLQALKPRIQSLNIPDFKPEQSAMVSYLNEHKTQIDDAIPNEHKKHGYSVQNILDNMSGGEESIATAFLPLAQALGRSDAGKQLKQRFFGDGKLSDIMSQNSLLNAAQVDHHWLSKLRAQGDLRRVGEPKLTFWEKFAHLKRQGPTAFMVLFIAISFATQLFLENQREAHGGH